MTTGCNSVDSVTVSIGLLPVASIESAISPQICGINDGQITVTYSSAYTYEWSTSETSQTITPAASDTYWCIVSDSLGCLSDTAFYTFVFTSTMVKSTDSLIF